MLSPSICRLSCLDHVRPGDQIVQGAMLSVEQKQNINGVTNLWKSDHGASKSPPQGLRYYGQGLPTNALK